MLRRLVLVALLTSMTTLLTARAPAFAKEELTPEQQIEKALAKRGKKIADKHRTLSRWCKSKKFKLTAISHLRIALAACPDMKSLRRDLGYAKVDGAWVLKRPPDLSKLEDENAPGEDYFGRDAKNRMLRVGSLLDIADKARTLGLAARSRELVERALLLDPQNETVRGRLGHVLIQRRWFSQEEAEAVPRTSEVQQVEGVSPLSKMVGVQLNVWQSGPWVIETIEGPETCRFLLEAARRGEGISALLLTGKPAEAGASRLTVTGLGDRVVFGTYIDKSGLPKDRADAAKAMNTVWNDGRCILGGTLTPDWLLHLVAFVTLKRSSDDVPSWFTSGFTDYVSERVTGTMITRFVTVERSAGIRHGAAKSASATWRIILRNLAAVEKDPPCGIIFSSSLTGLTTVDVMKSWSLIDYLFRRDPEAFIRFAEQIFRVDTLQALQEAYAMTPDALDEVWREWIIRVG